jgi:hypothetical protein
MPWGDWQFWVVTAAAVAGLLVVATPFVAKRRRRGPRVELTVDRRPVKGKRTPAKTRTTS